MLTTLEVPIITRSFVKTSEVLKKREKKDNDLIKSERWGRILKKERDASPLSIKKAG
jgi:hypothetical protein